MEELTEEKQDVRVPEKRRFFILLELLIMSNSYKGDSHF